VSSRQHIKGAEQHEVSRGICRSTLSTLQVCSVSSVLPVLLRGTAAQWHLLEDPLLEGDTSLQRTASLTLTSPCLSSLLWFLQNIITI